jgi:hypothetical protein
VILHKSFPDYCLGLPSVFFIYLIFGIFGRNSILCLRQTECKQMNNFFYDLCTALLAQ